MPFRTKSLPGRAAISLLVAAGVLGVGLVAASAAAPLSMVPTGPTPDLIKNGQFATKGAFTTARIGPGYSQTIAPWTTGSTVIYLLNTTYLKAPKGLSQSVSLYGAGNLGTVSQTLKTTPGTTYILQWYGAATPNLGTPVPTKAMNVIWDNGVVAAPKYHSPSLHATCSGGATECPPWTLSSVVVTASSTTSTVEFADATPIGVGAGPLVADATLAGDAKLYLPSSASVARTGKVTAVVDNAKGAALGAPNSAGLKVYLYGLIKTESYAPATVHLLATASVVNGQAVLALKLAASMVGKALTAYAVLRGGVYKPVIELVKLRVT